MATGWKKDYFRYKAFFLNILSIYNTKPNLKIYLELTLSLSMIIIFAIFAIKPTVLTIIELNNKIKTKEDIISRLNQKIINLQTASNILQTNSEDLMFIEKAVPNTASPEILIKQIESLANQSSLQIIGLSMSEIIITGNVEKKANAQQANSLAGGANELPLSLTVRGDYQNLFTFLTNMELLLRPVKIDSISFNSSNTEEGKILTMLITGRVPFLIVE